MIESFWTNVEGDTLRQGDLLPNVLVPVLPPRLTPDAAMAVAVHRHDLIVVTQSCDLEQRKVRNVALLSARPISVFEQDNPVFARKGRWNEVLKGRVESLHLLGSPVDPNDNHTAVLVDFRDIFSLSFDSLVEHAASISPRWRLRSPYLEHFSQAFARFFMRVGLPSSIPEFQ